MSTAFSRTMPKRCGGRPGPWLAAMLVCSFALPGDLPAQARPGGDGALVPGEVLEVAADGVGLRAGPGADAAPVLDVPLSMDEGRSIAVTPSRAEHVEVLVSDGDWVRIRLIEGRGRSTKPGAEGWVQRADLTAVRAPEAYRTFTTADFDWARIPVDLRAELLAAVNRAHRDQPDCRDAIDPSSLGATGGLSAVLGAPVFGIACGAGERRRFHFIYDVGRGAASAGGLAPSPTPDERKVATSPERSPLEKTAMTLELYAPPDNQVSIVSDVATQRQIADTIEDQPWSDITFLVLKRDEDNWFEVSGSTSAGFSARYMADGREFVSSRAPDSIAEMCILMTSYLEEDGKWKTAIGWE